jgi:predicted nucleotidyltransferase
MTQQRGHRRPSPGSFGRGEADNGSDVDLLVIVRDEDFGAFIDPERNRL